MFGLKKIKEKRAEKKRQKKQEVKRRVLMLLQWYFALFCFSSMLVYGFQAGSILMVLIGVAVLPLQPIRDIWNIVLKDKATVKRKAILLSVLFIVGCCLLPATEPEEIELSDTQIVTETESSEIELDIQVVVIPSQLSTEPSISASDIPAYSGEAYVALSNNVPDFSTSDLSPVSYEYYSDLDSLGRCGVVYACIGQEIMPTEERGSIGQIKPSGWHTVKYDIIDGMYLYNRCHLIGYQLSAENANEKNLITGTRQMNMDGMLPFENMVADYIKETSNHVMYRVTPVFEGNNLLAKGVQMEAYSIEDDGEGICFNVFVYNVQDDIEINYANGDSKLIVATESDTQQESLPQNVPEQKPEQETGIVIEVETEAIQELIPEPQPLNSETLVWKTATGSKYHSYNSCGRTNPANATQITESQAISMGLGKCSKCW